MTAKRNQASMEEPTATTRSPSRSITSDTPISPSCFNNSSSIAPKSTTKPIHHFFSLNPKENFHRNRDGNYSSTLCLWFRLVTAEKESLNYSRGHSLSHDICDVQRISTQTTDDPNTVENSEKLYDRSGTCFLQSPATSISDKLRIGVNASTADTICCRDNLDENKENASCCNSDSFSHLHSVSSNSSPPKLTDIISPHLEAKMEAAEAPVMLLIPKLHADVGEASNPILLSSILSDQITTNENVGSMSDSSTVIASTAFSLQQGSGLWFLLINLSHCTVHFPVNIKNGKIVFKEKKVSYANHPETIRGLSFDYLSHRDDRTCLVSSFSAWTANSDGGWKRFHAGTNRPGWH